MTDNTNKCIQCNSTYNTNQKHEIYTKLGRNITHELTIYNDTCLDCSIEMLNDEANKSLLLLNKAVRKLRIFERLYKKLREAKQKIESCYYALDQQHNYIKFYLREEAHKLSNKPTVTRKARASRKNSSASKQAALIAALLKSMTPEQQALIAQQAAKL